MKTLLKNAREAKGLTIRDVARQLKIDKALISKFESGARKPTKEQILKLAALLKIDAETIIVAWWMDKIVSQIEREPLALKVLQAVEKEIKDKNPLSGYTLSDELKHHLNTIDQLRLKLNQYSRLELENVFKKTDIAYTYESNCMDGNTLTLDETDLVVSKGMTIAGKSMKEHLEAINHHEAISETRKGFSKGFILSRENIANIHHLITRGIQGFDKHAIQRQANHSGNENDSLFNWFNANKNSLHPIILAAKTYEFLIQDTEFKNLKGSTLRLIMNAILSSHGYLNIHISSHPETMAKYQQAIQNAQTANDESFQVFVAQAEIESLGFALKLLERQQSS